MINEKKMGYTKGYNADSFPLLTVQHPSELYIGSKDIFNAEESFMLSYVIAIVESAKYRKIRCMSGKLSFMIFVWRHCETLLIRAK